MIQRNEIPISICPRCGFLFLPFLRGQVRSYWRRWLGLPSWSLICSRCKSIVGHEKERVV